MNKLERQNKIKNLIQTGHLGTQEEIKKELSLEGISVTQATLSRDLREIGLLKARGEDGKLYYRLADPIVASFSQSVKSYIVKVDRAGFMLVLHTKLGESDVLANFIDEDNIPEILGTVAGADTVLVICKDEETAKVFEQNLN